MSIDRDQTPLWRHRCRSDHFTIPSQFTPTPRRTSRENAARCTSGQSTSTRTIRRRSAADIDRPPLHLSRTRIFLLLSSGETQKNSMVGNRQYLNNFRRTGLLPSIRSDRRCQRTVFRYNKRKQIALSGMSLQVGKNKVNRRIYSTNQNI